MAVRITCIKKDGGNHENPFVAITSMNWLEDGTGNTGTASRIQMYDWVVSGGHAYVQDSAGNRARLVGKISANNNKFVQTEADNVQSDNLLKLPECR